VSWSRRHGSFALFGAAAFLLAFAVGVDVLFAGVGRAPRASGGTNAPRLASVVSHREASDRDSFWNHFADRNLSNVEFSCPEPARLSLSDGRQYAPRYSAVIPVRSGLMRLSLEHDGRRRQHSIRLEPGETAVLPCD
jgi:hypothetical protein